MCDSASLAVEQGGEEAGGGVGFGAEVGEAGFQESVGAAGSVGATDVGLQLHGVAVELFGVGVEGYGAFEGGEGVFGGVFVEFGDEGEGVDGVAA